MASYVRIIVPRKLSRDQFTLWFNTVEKTLVSGLIGETQLTPDTYSKFYSKKLGNNRHTYVVPLVRDLDASEVHQLLQAWNKAYPEGDFVFDYSQPVEHVQPTAQDIPDQKIAQVMEAWSKQQHQAWMQDHLARGWRFGVALSVANKTHPWLQPWESLPQAAKVKNMQACKDLLERLHDFGYTIVQKLDA